MRVFKLCALLVTALYCATSSSRAAGDTFGSGVNQFTMEFVPIGNPGNVADTTGTPNPAGSVAYNYEMGKFEVSRDMVTKANSAGGLAITLVDLTPFGGNGVNRPANGVSWNEAARFVNWLNTSHGFQAAYKFATQPGDGGYGPNQEISLWVSGDAGFNAANPFRNSQARYFLPSVDEWYKAAYYDPSSGDYFDDSTGSNSVPLAVASGTTAGTAVYGGQFGPADITLAGGLSPYGVMGLGGNVNEWEETEFDLVNDSISSRRGVRGGYWGSIYGSQLSSFRGGNFPTFDENFSFGFRVASIPIPEPGTQLLGALTAIGLLLRRRVRLMTAPQRS